MISTVGIGGAFKVSEKTASLEVDLGRLKDFLSSCHNTGATLRLTSDNRLKATSGSLKKLFLPRRYAQEKKAASDYFQTGKAKITVGSAQQCVPKPPPPAIILPDGIMQHVRNKNDVMACGPSEMSSAAWGRIAQAIGRARDILDMAVQRMDEGIIHDVFDSANTSTLQSDFEAIRLVISNYLSTRQSRVFLVRQLNPGAKDFAFVYPSDPLERIFLTDRLLAPDQSCDHLALSLIHEISHLKLGAGDFLYYEIASHPDMTRNEWLDALQSSAHAASRGEGPANEIIARRARAPGVSVDLLKRVFGTSDHQKIVMGLETGTGGRLNALRNNADSIALAAFLMSRDIGPIQPLRA